MASDTQSDESSGSLKETIFNTLPGLGHWNFYFIIKIVMYFKDLIGFNALLNLGFIAFLLFPTKNKKVEFVKQLCAWPIAIILFYSDSWLPPFTRIIEQFHNIHNFNLVYLFELTERFINIEIVTTIFILWVSFIYLRQWLRISVLTTILTAFITLNLFLPAHEELLDEDIYDKHDLGQNNQANNLNMVGTPDQSLSNFYEYEKTRTIIFPTNISELEQFDILVLNICSLSWSDLEYTGLTKHPIFKEFDITLSSFNSVSSYSGPAVNRLFRASCGQVSHTDIFNNNNESCNLFNSLASLGFQKELVFNHDGKFDNFKNLVQKTGQINVPVMDLDNVTISQRSFDSSPIYSDQETLQRWMNNSANNMSDRTVTYYNTISLHDGNRFTGNLSQLNSLENFHPRASKLLGDLTKFFKELEKSERKILVIFVPEHGAAIKGDTLQVAGLRELPSKNITNVPVGFRLFGPGIKRPESTLLVSKPTSYLAIAHVINQLLQADPFGKGSYEPFDIASTIPSTHFVAENKGTVILKNNNNYLMKYDSEDWVEYPTEIGK